ncbi:MAG: HAMP domain-containing histidine kinase [Flavobacteriales bacterium]|nr:HAMP domain-containing histidine kinase [Flavobacteriales bacterium]NCP84261.1 HAMP domain-containing histidine kinase [Bacteroidota bacterium]
MENKKILSLPTNWITEIYDSVLKSNSQCVALFSKEGDLLFSNPAFNFLVKGEFKESFINPSFESLLKMKNSSSLIFDGFITLGNLESLNTSIIAQVYRKSEILLLVGGIESKKLVEQNLELAELNRDNVNLHRELLKKSSFLEHTLHELAESNKELTKEKVTRDRLFSVIAHDLRSPFGVIVSFSDLLIKKMANLNSETNIKYVNQIKFSAQNTLYLLDNLLNWAKIQTGKIRYKPNKVRLTSAILEVMDGYNVASEIKNINLRFLPKEDLEVVVDSDMLQVVLRNLISNALKFTPDKGIISISADQKLDHIEVSVADTGVGIQNEKLLTLFNKDTNETTAGTADEKGSGIGLVLCKDFVEKLGGTIWAESELGTGSVFKFTIPLM